MSFFEFIITLFIVYFCLYSLVGRVCQCIERYKLYNSLGKYLEKDKMQVLSDLKTGVDNFGELMKNDLSDMQ